MSSRLLGLILLLAALGLAGCSPPPPGVGEPSPREVRQQLEKTLSERHNLFVTDFHDEGEHRYKAIAKDAKGTTYRVTVTTEGRSLTYQAEGTDVLGQTTEVLRGQTPKWSEPPFEERHPQAMQWLRGTACGLHVLGVLWPLLGRIGWRRRYSARTERVLSVFAAVNLGFALLWGYLFVTNLGTAP